MYYDTIIEESAAILLQGRTILYPTDTIWGLGCDACNMEAVQKIFDIKQRNEEKPFVILVDSIKMLKEYVTDIHPRVETLLSFHKRPLTLIYQNAINLPPISIAKNKTVAIRIVTDDFCKELIKTFGRPIISTSANISNDDPPKNYKEISDNILNKVDYIVNHRRDEEIIGVSSVIATFDKKGELIILRE